VLAPKIETQLRALTAKGQAYNYDRAAMKAFQIAAGLKPDAIYGGGTRGAMVFYGATRAPAPLYAPTTTIPYTPPA
jgi:murein L,D-transpeptidase YcbB/YkuD